MTAGNLSLRVYCIACRKPALITVDEEVRATAVTWDCPWCTKKHQDRLGGRVVRVARGREG
jgi:hypothetical protein